MQIFNNSTKHLPPLFKISTAYKLLKAARACSLRFVGADVRGSYSQSLAIPCLLLWRHGTDVEPAEAELPVPVAPVGNAAAAALSLNKSLSWIHVQGCTKFATEKKVVGIDDVLPLYPVYCYFLFKPFLTYINLASGWAGDQRAVTLKKDQIIRL